MRDYVQLPLFEQGAAPARPAAALAALADSDEIGPAAALAALADSDEIGPAAALAALADSDEIALAPRRSIGRADYEERLDGRRERLERAADRAIAESRRRLGAADQIAHAIPLGQPILVGHHSEKRHRRDLERMRSNTTRGLEAQETAVALRQAADRAGSAGISSDDPNAVEKLQAKLAEEEEEREGMKRVNAAYRVGGWEKVASLPGVTQDHVAGYQRYMALVPGRRAVPFPPFKFTNLGANIRRIKERIAALQAETVREDFEPLVGDGWAISEDCDQNRLVLRFDVKPSKETLALLGGWHFSRSQRAHLRLNNPRGRYAARDLAQRLAQRGRDQLDQLRRDLLGIASGTLASLTRESQYSRLEAIQEELLAYFEAQHAAHPAWSTWMQVWDAFWAQRQAPVAPAAPAAPATPSIIDA